jgi:hypothetical protein
MAIERSVLLTVRARWASSVAMLERFITKLATEIELGIRDFACWLRCSAHVRNDRRCDQTHFECARSAARDAIAHWSVFWNLTASAAIIGDHRQRGLAAKHITVSEPGA